MPNGSLDGTASVRSRPPIESISLWSTTRRWKRSAIRGGLGIAALPCLVADLEADLVRRLPPISECERSLRLPTHQHVLHNRRFRATLDLLAERSGALARPPAQPSALFGSDDPTQRIERLEDVRHLLQRRLGAPPRAGWNAADLLISGSQERFYCQWMSSGQSTQTIPLSQPSAPQCL